MRGKLVLCAIATLAIPVTTWALGGWAVITVKSMPEYLEAGTPTRLEFTVRQHGISLVPGLSPTVTVFPEGGGMLAKKSRFPATPTGEAGVYSATVTVEKPGRVEIRIDPDFRGSEMRLLPLPVVAAGERPVSTSSMERGRALFVASGCVTCHVKSDDPLLEDYRAFPVGPELTGRGFAAAWLAEKVADPARFRPANGNGADGWTMPAMLLAEGEAEAIARYLNETAMGGTPLGPRRPER